MKTVVIIRQGWRFVKTYDFLIPISKGDLVEYDGIEYQVYAVCLDIDKDEYQVIIQA